LGQILFLFAQILLAASIMRMKGSIGLEEPFFAVDAWEVFLLGW
jgi:hypothetical protein